MINKALCFLLAVGSLSAADPLVYEGGEGIGKGKHIVFVANDHEYRSEQTCPMMAKIIAKNLGFKCTVLFGLNEEGEIQPGAKNLPGLEALEDADLMFFFTRFLNLPDEQVDKLVDYFERGGPVVGLRTSTHAFNGQKGKWEKLNFNYKGEDYRGGLGKQVFGTTWEKEVGQDHYGKNHRQGNQMTATEEAASHAILTGVGEIHTYSGAYSSPVPEGATSLLNLQVLNTFGASDDVAKDKPLVTGAWIRDFYVAPSGEKKEARVFYAPFGASEDLFDKNTCRLFVNACLWAMGMEKEITASLNTGMVGKYNPSPYSSGSLYFTGVKPADLADWDSSIMPEDAPLKGVAGVEGKKLARVKGILSNRPEMMKKFMPAEPVPAGE